MKRIILLLLSFLLTLFCIPSCKETEVDDTRKPVRAVDVWNVTQIPPQYPIPTIEGYSLRPSGVVVSDGETVFYGYMEIAPASSDIEEFFYPYNGTDAAPVRVAIPGRDALSDADARYRYVQLCCAAFTDDGGCGTVFTCAGGDQLVITDANGMTVASVSLDDVNTRGENLYEIFWSWADRMFYIRAESGVYAVSADGSVAEQVKLSARPLGCGIARDGRCYIVAYPTAGEAFGRPQITFLNGETRMPDVPLTLPDTLNLYNTTLYAHPAYDLCYSSGDGLYGFNFPGTDGEMEAPAVIVNFLNSDIGTGTLKNYVFQNENTAFALQYDHQTYADDICVMLTRVPETDLPEKYELHIACCMPGVGIYEMAKQFNAASETCRIVLDTYDRYTSDLYDEHAETNLAYDMLVRDILAGYRPDIIVGNGIFALDDLARQGLFCDLYSFLDSDPDFGRDALFGCVMTPFEDESGRLPYLVTAFTVQTMISTAARAASLAKEGWTASQAEAIGADLPSGTNLAYYSTLISSKDDRIEMLEALLPQYRAYAGDPAVMAELLSYCKHAELPSMKTEERRQALQNEALYVMESPFFNLQQYLSIRYEMFGGADIAFLGYPGPSVGAGGGSSVTASQMLGITTEALENPEIAAGAWEFCKLCATYVYDVYLGANLSAARSTLETIFAQMDAYHFAVGTDGRFSQGAGEVGANMTEVFLGEEERAALRALYNGITTRTDAHPTLDAIIIEDASAYFADAKSLDDTVTLITSRAKTYLSERESASITGEQP